MKRNKSITIKKIMIVIIKRELNLRNATLLTHYIMCSMKKIKMMRRKMINSKKIVIKILKLRK